MRLRLQKLDAADWGWAKVRVAMKLSPNEPWASVGVRQHKLSEYESRAGIEDFRDSAELHSQARAARREWGHEGGFAEWTPQHGVRRFPGDLLQEVPD